MNPLSSLPLAAWASSHNLLETICTSEYCVAWPKYRAPPMIGCRNALSNVHRSKLLAEIGNLSPPANAILASDPTRGTCCCGMGCPVCARARAPPLQHRKWPLVSVLINAGMKLRRHYLRHTEAEEEQGCQMANFAAQRSGAIVQKPEGPNTYDLKIWI